MAVNPLAIGGGVVAAAAIVGGGLYAGGVFGGSEPVKGTGSQIETPISIKKAGEYSETGDNNKFGNEFSYFFLSAGNTKNNSEWERREADLKAKQSNQLETDSFFEAVRAGTGNAKLKDKCKDRYDQLQTEYQKPEDKAKWKEVWIYCSLLKAQPKTIDESKDDVASDTNAATERGFATNTQSATKFGESLKAKVISTYYVGNKKFWELKEEEFKERGSTTGYFNKDKENRQSIKELCREAYKQPITPPSSGGLNPAPTDTEIKKFCSVDRTNA